VLISQIPSISKDNMNDRKVVLNDLFYKLIEKQAKRLEEFGKQMSLDLQASFKEHLAQQSENRFENSMETLVEFEKNMKKRLILNHN